MHFLPATDEGFTIGEFELARTVAEWIELLAIVENAAVLAILVLIRTFLSWTPETRPQSTVPSPRPKTWRNAPS
jgi:hypothetical protein